MAYSGSRSPSRYELEDEDNESDERKEAWISQATKLDEKFYLPAEQQEDLVPAEVAEQSRSFASPGGAGGAGQMEVVLKRAHH